MANALMMLLKAYKCEDWANEFLDGCLYCNTLSFHREVDDQEGAIVISGADIAQFKFKIGERELKTASNFTYRSNAADHINVFCMYSWAPPFEDNDKRLVILDKESQLGSLRSLEASYGRYTVMVRDIPEFFRRLDTAVTRADGPVIEARGNLVKYNLYSGLPSSVSTLDGMMELAFHKNPKYAEENEYRFVFQFDQEKAGPFRFDIGDIRNIAVLTRTRDIYASIAVNGSYHF